ncbi:hypothetical protein B9G55_18985 [Saccharibacillus sp. O16]|nr:hypothetical protein B9G55_18985 [Saccharibacillus sp. O16]
MDIKTRIGQVTAESYARAGSLAACMDLGNRGSLAEFMAEADEHWRSGEMLTLTFDYPVYTVYVTFSTDGVYRSDSMEFEPSALSADSSLLASFPRTAGEMREKIGQGSWDAKRFNLDQETVYLLPSGMTVHYVGEGESAPLVRIAGVMLDYAATHAYLRKLSSID